MKCESKSQDTHRVGGRFFLTFYPHFLQPPPLHLFLQADDDIENALTIKAWLWYIFEYQYPSISLKLWVGQLVPIGISNFLAMDQEKVKEQKKEQEQELQILGVWW